MITILFSHVYVLFVQYVVASSPYKTLLPKDLLATVHTAPLKTPMFPSLSPLSLCVSLVCFCVFAGWCVTYMQKACDVAEKAILAKKNCGKSA